MPFDHELNDATIELLKYCSEDNFTMMSKIRARLNGYGDITELIQKIKKGLLMTPREFNEVQSFKDNFNMLKERIPNLNEKEKKAFELSADEQSAIDEMVPKFTYYGVEVDPKDIISVGKIEIVPNEYLVSIYERYFLINDSNELDNELDDELDNELDDYEYKKMIETRKEELINKQTRESIIERIKKEYKASYYFDFKEYIKSPNIRPRPGRPDGYEKDIFAFDTEKGIKLIKGGGGQIRSGRRVLERSHAQENPPKSNTSAESLVATENNFNILRVAII